MIRKILALAVLVIPALAIAQSSPSVTINITSNAPGTATVLRAAGSCPTTGVPSSGTTLSSSVSVSGTGTANTGSYTDTTVAAGSTYCYWVTEAAMGGGSGVSNTFLGSIGVTVSITGKVQ